MDGITKAKLLRNICNIVSVASTVVIWIIGGWIVGVLSIITMFSSMTFVIVDEVLKKVKKDE